MHYTGATSMDDIRKWLGDNKLRSVGEVTMWPCLLIAVSIVPLLPSPWLNSVSSERPCQSMAMRRFILAHIMWRHPYVPADQANPHECGNHAYSSVCSGVPPSVGRAMRESTAIQCHSSTIMSGCLLPSLAWLQRATKVAS